MRLCTVSHIRLNCMAKQAQINFNRVRISSAPMHSVMMCNKEDRFQFNHPTPKHIQTGYQQAVDYKAGLP